jgi:hypothetical protein
MTGYDSIGGDKKVEWEMEKRKHLLKQNSIKNDIIAVIQERIQGVLGLELKRTSITGALLQPFNVGFHHVPATSSRSYYSTAQQPSEEVTS